MQRGVREGYSKSEGAGVPEDGNFREFHVEYEVDGGKRSALLNVQFWFRPKREQ